jgi:4-amino-4-deoxy-L-arabinose transferase-like glycosyltransferase
MEQAPQRLKSDLAWVLLLSLSVRAAALLVVPRLYPSLFQLGETWGDCFVCIARDILEEGLGEALGLPVKPIGFPLVLAALLKTAGGSLWPIRVFQLICGSLSCCTVYLIGLRLFDRRVALAAGLLSSIYPFFVRQDVTLYAESLFMLLYLAAFYCIVSLILQFKARYAWLAGLFLGLAALVKPAPLPLIPVLTLYLASIFRSSWHKVLQVIVGVAAVPAVFLAPWTLRNASLGYGFRMSDSRDGITFYYGNSPFAEHYYFENTDIREVYGDRWREHMGLTGELTDSAYYYAKAFEYIREHPRMWMRLMLVKLAAFWKMWPYHNRNPVTIAGYAFVPVFGLLGFFLFLPRAPSVGMLILITFLLFTVFFTVYFVDIRYRIPVIDPFLVLFAASVPFSVRTGQARGSTAGL